MASRSRFAFVFATTLAILLTAASVAPAAVRYASPSGTAPASGPCAAIAPCGLLGAIDNAYVNNGDEVVLAPGEYDITGSVPLVTKDLDVHGQGPPALTRIVGGYWQGSSAVGAKIRNVEIAALGAALIVGNGTADRVIARSQNSSGCEISDGVIRDSICITQSSSHQAGLSASSGSYTHNVALRNVTAIGAGGSNSYGLAAYTNGGLLNTPTRLTIDAKSVIARGATFDVYALAIEEYNILQVNLDHSNFANYYAAAARPGGIASVSYPSENNNQSDLPAFIDAAAGNYHQASSSSTVDAGVTDANSGTADVDGDTRALGAAVDIGADEYNATVPAIPVITTPNGQLVGGHPPPITGTAAPGETVTIYDDGVLAGTTMAGITGEWACSFFSYQLDSGMHDVTADATNASGITSATSEATVIEVDNTPPAIAITAPSAGSIITDSTPAIAFTVTEAHPDANPSFCILDGSTYFNCSSGDSLDALSEGVHVLDVTDTDVFGNNGTSSVSFTIDTAAPVVTITSPAPGAISAGVVNVQFTVLDVTATSTTCALDGAAETSCTSPHLFGGLNPGSHSVTVKAVDQLGNVGAASVAFSVSPPAPPAPPVQPAVPAKVATALAQAGRSKRSGKKLLVTLSMTFALPAGAQPTVGCTGTVAATAKPRGVKRLVRSKAPLTPFIFGCKASLKFKLTTKQKGKKVAFAISYPGNSVVAAIGLRKSIKIK